MLWVYQCSFPPVPGESGSAVLMDRGWFTLDISQKLMYISHAYVHPENRGSGWGCGASAGSEVGAGSSYCGAHCFVSVCSSELLEVRRENWLLEFELPLQRHRVTLCQSREDFWLLED